MQCRHFSKLKNIQMYMYISNQVIIFFIFCEWYKKEDYAYTGKSTVPMGLVQLLAPSLFSAGGARPMDTLGPESSAASP